MPRRPQGEPQARARRAPVGVQPVEALEHVGALLFRDARPAPVPRKQTPDLWKGEENDRANPLNPPYDPESVAVRGKGGQPLSDDLKQRVGERLKGTNFENMDLDSLKLYRGKAPWYMPRDKGAITLENHVYIPLEEFDPENNTNHFNVLMEEAVHAGQFQYRDMTRAGYLWESLLRGYDENRYEKEAKGIAFPSAAGGGGSSSQPNPRLQEMDLRE